MESLLGRLAEFLGESDQHFATVAIELGTAAIEESAAGGFGEFDAQTFGGDGHLDVAFQFFEIRHLPHGLLQLFLQLRHVVAGENEIFAGPSHVGADFLGEFRWGL